VSDHRLGVYRSQTLQMLEWFEQREQVVLVDGHGAVATVGDAVVRGIQEWLLRRRLASANRWAYRSHPDATVASRAMTPASGRSAP
jgi:ActR/RegA family two-component response regulator